MECLACDTCFAPPEQICILTDSKGGWVLSTTVLYQNAILMGVVHTTSTDASPDGGHHRPQPLLITMIPPESYVPKPKKKYPGYPVFCTRCDTKVGLLMGAKGVRLSVGRERRAINGTDPITGEVVPRDAASTADLPTDFPDRAGDTRFRVTFSRDCIRLLGEPNPKVPPAELGDGLKLLRCPVHLWHSECRTAAVAAGGCGHHMRTDPRRAAPTGRDRSAAAAAAAARIAPHRVERRPDDGEDEGEE